MIDYEEFIANMKYGLVLKLGFFSYCYYNSKIYTRVNAGGDWCESSTTIYDTYRIASIADSCQFIDEPISRRYIK